MFIQPVPDDDGVKEEGVEIANSAADQTYAEEFQTASELFDIMARNHNFESNDVDLLTARDLVILYKNIDLGTKLMSSANEFKSKKPNQHVETVVYNEEPDTDSDLSEIYSNEDLHNVISINNERIDLFANQSSLENTLCHKFGDLEMKTTNLNSMMERQLFLKDPFIKEQIHSLSLMANTNECMSSILPSTLLDYMCCKKLEDNYNFYMDNIIKYVKHTIEQLKRISNGDFLTEKAKAKWKEVENAAHISLKENNAKVLESSTSMPLHVERKVSGAATTWDDIVHSEVDIRYLSKILEKKIRVEIPKIICGSYKLFSKYCKDNLIISCVKEKTTPQKKEDDSRVDVVFKLERSLSGHVVSNISSVIVLQSQEICPPEVLPLAYAEDPMENGKIDDNVDKVNDDLDKCDDEEYDTQNDELKEDDNSKLIEQKHNTTENVNDISYDAADARSEYTASQSQSDSFFPTATSDSSNGQIREIFHKNCKDDSAPFNMLIAPDELHFSMQRLNVQSTLTEENMEDVSEKHKRRSPQRPRIKSPYENSSYIIEEKKRKKLLEIRERREKKKMAMSEHCKITKPKYTKATIMPQPSNSVTKLSITNKSFYNSIYGQTMNGDLHKLNKLQKNLKDKRNITLDMYDPDDDESKLTELTNQNTESSNKFVNRNYYLDNAVTEVMYWDMNKDKGESMMSETLSTNDINYKIETLAGIVSSRVKAEQHTLDEINETKDVDEFNNIDLEFPQRVTAGAGPPVNTPRAIPKVKEHSKKTSASNTSVEFKKSIDKLYNLIKRVGKSDKTDSKPSKSKFTTSTSDKVSGQESSVIQCSDSGTSMKHHPTSSNPSYYSFEKSNTEAMKSLIPKPLNNQKPKPTNVVSKVIITAKTQTKPEAEKTKGKRKVASPSMKMDNPLKAISQLLHDIDQVQKTRLKSANEPKNVKKTEIHIPDGKHVVSRQNSYKKRGHQIPKDPEPSYPKTKERRSKLGYMTGDSPRINALNEERNRMPRKQVVDMVDEYKEAKGEAVRGPSRWNARLNSLAQPKKSYVQATIEECQTRYGRHMVPERLHRLATSPHSPDKTRPYSEKRKFKKVTDLTSTASPRLPPSSERAVKRNPFGNKPEIYSLSVNETSYKQRNVANKPSILKKMVAVESYVKNHYGQSSHEEEPNSLLLDGFSARVPLLPSDIVLDSSFTSSPGGEESSIIGKKLHNLLDSLITNAAPILPIVTECTEPSSKEVDDYSHRHHIPKTISSKPDEDDFNRSTIDNSLICVDTYCDKQCDAMSVQANTSEGELEKLESALHRRLSVSTFQKRLRIKNLTITPKQSMPQVLLLQSGDVGPLIVKKSTTAHDIFHTDSGTSPNNVSVGWNFSTIPMQIATVGYAFPVNDQVKDNVLKIGNKEHIFKAGGLTDCFDKYPAESLWPVTEAAAQVDIKEIVIANMFQINPIVAVDDKETMPSDEVQPLENPSPENEVLDPECKLPEDQEQNQKVNLNPIPEKSELDLVDINSRQLFNDNSSSNHTRPETSSIMQDSANSDKNNDCIDYTSSLDILAGLLNEIQKITTHQSQLAQVEVLASDLNNKKAPVQKVQKTSDVVIESQGIISVNSLEKIRNLGSSQSIISCYLSNDGESINSCELDLLATNVLTNFFDNITGAKQQVHTDAPEKAYVHQFTEKPSFLPININRSTNVSNSFIGILSRPSNQSLVSLAETYYHDAALVTRKNIIELPSDGLDLPKIAIAPKKKKEKISNAIHVQTIKGSAHDKQIQNTASTIKNSTKSVWNKSMDPVMKMKRDFLVTVYSILVFTVFAALSLPDLYHS